MKAKLQRHRPAKRLRPFCLCGAEMALHYLHELLAEVRGVRQGEDPECVHRMRVAARRLQSTLPLYALCVSRQACARWRKYLRRLTRALGGVRDVDVQLACIAEVRSLGVEAHAQAGLARIHLRLRQQRQALQPRLLAALQRFVESAVSTEMEQTLRQVMAVRQPAGEARPGRVAYRRMRKALRKRLEDLTSYAPYVQRPECVEALHAMRLAAKRLRYTLQAFAPFYPDGLAEAVQAARTLQDLLGDLHDCDVWAVQLSQFLDAEWARTEAYFGHTQPFACLVPGIHVLQHNRAQFREQRYQAFVACWQESQTRGVWERLRQALETPLQPPVETPAEGAG